MENTDLIVWPLFVVQLFTFLLFFLPAKARFLWIPIQRWVVICILAVNIAIVVSLGHDSTSILHLHF